MTIYIDSETGIVALTPSGSDIEPSVDVAINRTSFTPSSLDVGPFSDSNTSQVIFTPKTTVELHTISDSNTAVVKLASQTYEIRKGGVVHHVIPPKDSIEYAAYLLRNLEREIERIVNNKRPTMPIYDRTSFPQDATTGQHAIAKDGSLWLYNGGWVLIAGS